MSSYLKHALNYLFPIQLAYYVILFLVSSAWGLGQAQPLSFSQLKQKGEKTKVARGLHLYTLQSDVLFDSKQSLSVLLVRKSRKLSIAYESTTLKPTSTFGTAAKALAAVNAGFFDMRKGGSVTYLMVDESVVAANTNKNPAITTHAVAIDDKGRLKIFPQADTAQLEQIQNIDDVLFTGPLLLFDRQEKVLPNNSFSDKRHPRTCVCQRKNGQVLLITIDGRNEQAAGMSLPELTTLLKGLQCKSAINLDGGGSTTMWLKEFGVVNHPSDNKKFDGAGERRVSNVILVH